MDPERRRVARPAERGALVGPAPERRQARRRVVARSALACFALISLAAGHAAATFAPPAPLAAIQDSEVARVRREIDALYDGSLPIPPGSSQGREVSARCRELERLGATKDVTGENALFAGLLLLNEGEYELARIEFAALAGDAGVAESLRDSARVELAQIALASQRYAEAHDLLQEARAVIEAASVGRALAGGAAAGAREIDDRERSELLLAARWLSGRTILELDCGRPDRSEGFLEEHETLVEILGSDYELWETTDLRLRLELALNDYGALLRYLDRPNVAKRIELLAATIPDVPAKVELRRAIAEYQLCLTKGRDASAVRARLAELARHELLGIDERRNAALRVAIAGADLGDVGAIESGVSDVRRMQREAGATAPSSATVDAMLAALDVAAAIESRDEEALRKTLDGLESSLPAFVVDWERAAFQSTGVAFFRSGDRYLIPEQLLRGAIELEGPEAGARRALRWIHRLHRIGGLARALLDPQRSDGFAGDLASLTSGGRGVMLYQPGRIGCRLILADERGIDVELVAPNWKIVEACTALANAAGSAIHRGGSLNDPDVAAASIALSERALGPRARERLASWTEVTVIGAENFGPMPLDLIEIQAGVRLGERVALGYAPSLPVGAELARRARGAGRISASALSSLLIGAPDAVPGETRGDAAAPLSIARERLERWRDSIAGRCEVRSGSGARAGELLAPEGARLALSQIVSHGHRDTSRECAAGFVLYGDELEQAVVTSDEVERGRSARVTLLAVCGAALRPVLRGDDGRTALAASFVIAGSDCVVQTPTDLEASNAVELFERVSSLVSRGASPASALVRARRERADRGAAHLQDYLVHGWGAALEPIAELSPIEEPATGSSHRGPWIAALVAAAVLAAAGALIARGRRGA